MLKGKEICQLAEQKIKTGKPLDMVCEELLDQLLAKETQDGLGCDNMSILIVQILN